jgi:1,4-alpha-glucan branching enzyme
MPVRTIKGESLPILDEHLDLSECQVICESKGLTMKRTGKKATGPRNMTQHVRMEYLNTSAKSVFAAGTFNDWHPQVTEMLKLADGRWAKELTLTPGTYEYRLVVDGQWTADPGCRESVPNPCGGRNSVFTLSG